MPGYLRQSTAATIPYGPFLDDTDFKTAEVALTIQKADVRLKKNGGDAAAASADQGASDAGAPHDEQGFYDGSLNTTDTNTLGRLDIFIKESGALVFFDRYEVIPANVFDSLVAGSDALDVSLIQWLGTAPLALSSQLVQVADSAGVTTLLSRITSTLFSGITQLSHWLGAIAGKQAANATAQTEIRATGAGSGTYDATTDSQEAIRDNMGTAQTGDSFARLGAPAGASHAADIAAIKTDTGNLVTRITSTLFSGITSMAQWLGLIAGKQTGDSTARTEMRATGAGSGTYDETTDSLEAIRDAGASPGDIADAVWDEATSGHATAGTTGKALTDAGSAGDPWSTALPGAYGAGTAGKIVGDNLNATVGSRASQASVDTVAGYLDTEIASIITSLSTIAGYLDTEIAAILADTNELQTDWANGGRLDLLIDAMKAVLDAIPNAGAMTDIAQNATVAKEATLTSTGRADPSALGAALGSSLSPLAKLDWILASVMRGNTFNKTTGERIIKNAAGTDIAKSTHADDGTTVTRGAFGAP